MPTSTNAPTRRTFLKTTAATAAVTVTVPAVHAAGSDVIKVGVIGCGGRGRGAAIDALKADPNVKITALCDIFPDFLANAYESLKRANSDRVDVPPERRYSGFDGYKQLIDTADVDIVFLCAPPGFRPEHLRYAVNAGKHVFAEKPMAVDAPGVRSVLESAAIAKKRNLLCASGFCYRYEPAKKETIKRIHDGMIGDVVALHVSYNTGEIWHRGRKPEWSEMEEQIRNWYYYTWLSGDHLVEQACHNIDKACWVLGEQYPIAATGLGGRQVRTDPKFGNIWDHFALVYEYANGLKVFANCRQMPNCVGDVNDHVFGTKGSAQLMKHTVTPTGGSEWEYDGPMPSMYVEEHKAFLASLRAGSPINDMASAAYSTLMAILGRQAAYTGRRITWKQILESKEDLSPKTLAWGPNPVPPVAMPGQTKFV
jgi:myo-inositol 2-dehydrogenase/D-chiro-inositol 1-dehydrogenase